MQNLDEVLAEVSNDPAAMEDARRLAYRLVMARAQRDATFKDVLRTNPREAFRLVGAAAALPKDLDILAVPEGTLVLHVPDVKTGDERVLKTLEAKAARFARRRQNGNEDPPEDPDPPPQIYAPFRGQAHHWANNPFSGGHKGYDIWTITLPKQIHYSQVGFNDTTGQVSLEQVEHFVTSGGESFQHTLKLHFRWWYNMWFDTRYEFAIFSGDRVSGTDFYFGQDDGAPAPSKSITFASGFIQRVLDGRDLDDSIVITPA